MTYGPMFSDDADIMELYDEEADGIDITEMSDEELAKTPIEDLLTPDQARIWREFCEKWNSGGEEEIPSSGEKLIEAASEVLYDVDEGVFGNQSLLEPPTITQTELTLAQKILRWIEAKYKNILPS